MDSMELNKAMAGVLVAGIMFFLAGLVAMNLVTGQRLPKLALLYRVVSAACGHMPGFTYSAGMKAKPGSWTFSELNEWLHKPGSFVPGTRMAFAGISNDQQRADVIAYLRSLSANPETLPRQ